MKQVALLLIMMSSSIFANAQHKVHQKVASIITSLAAYRPTVRTGIDIEYSVKKKIATVKKRHARVGRRCVHKSRVRKQSNIRLYASIGFHTGKLAKK